MSWRKHFTIHKNKSPISGDKSIGNQRRGEVSRFQSWLPEVYVGQPNRVERYIQYDQMDADSEVNTALDTIAEFSTQDDPSTGLPFSVKWLQGDPSGSESEVVLTVLKQWCRINEWNTRIFTTFRNIIKYGDQPFIRDPETWKLFYVNPADLLRVIVNDADGREPAQYVIRNLSPNFDMLTANAPTASDSYFSPAGLGPNSHGMGSTQRNAYAMGNNNSTNSYIERLIDADHVIHASLSDGMDIAWPFGKSVLDAIFKPYKQKELVEDSIIIYRVHRAPERRVFYIDTGDMPEYRAATHMERIKNEIHQRRMPTQTGGGSNMMDAQYNPLGVMEDYFLPVTSDGRGTKIETLPGGQNLGEIDDLKFFNNKLARGLRIPSSYLPTGPDDGTAAYTDGRVTSAFIQEFRFTKYCERLQKTIQMVFDKEFKMFLKHRGYQINSGHFEIGFSSPQSFSQYREIEINSARVQLFSQIENTGYLSKRFILSKYLGLTPDEILENEKMKLEENPIEKPDDIDDNDDDFSKLGDVGVRGGAGGLDDFASSEEPSEESTGNDEGFDFTGE